MSEGRASGSAGWVKILLGLSLAANMVFLGLTGGSWFSSAETRESRHSAPSAFLKTLPQERAEEVRAVFAEMRQDRRAARKKMRKVWQEVGAIMRAEEFDRDALEAAMGQIVDLRTVRDRTRYDKMVSFVSSLSHEERIAFSDAMRERWKRIRERREKRARARGEQPAE